MIGEDQMLEYLHLSIGGYFGGQENYLIWNKDGVLNVEVLYISSRSCADYRRGTLRKSLLMTPDRSKRWLQKLEQIHFDYWAESYYALNVCDGTQWSLTYKFSGEERKKCGGSNAYPENWSSFTSLINKITSKASAVLEYDDAENDLDEFFRLCVQVEKYYETKDETVGVRKDGSSCKQKSLQAY